MSKNIAKLNINNVDFTFKDAELRNTVSGLINEINNSNKVIATSLNDLDSRIPDISGKVDKIEGKGLSTEDYTTEEKTKLAGIAAGAEVNVQSDWEESDSTSDAYIANKPFESVNESHFYVDDNGQLGINDAIIGIDYNNWEDTGDSTVILSSGDNTAFEAVIPIAGRQLPVPGLITPEDYKKLDDIQPDYSKQYLTFVAKENGTFTFTPQNNNVISYSIDDGSTWTEGNEVTVNNGGRVLWKGSMTPNTSGIGAFSSTANFDVQGNIMSLLYGDDFIGQTDLTGKNYCFYQLFMQNTKVVNAKNLILPATTLASYCYQRMFRGCTSLTTAPVLPATTLASYCYQYMFQNCTSLTTAPSILPATTLANSCYYYMFNSCTSLTTAPELPATTLANSCYYYMFNDCTSLTTAPVLPATTLVSSCYNGMFYGCTSLTTAPVLPATTLASQCYCSMFYGCTSLTTAPELPTTTLASQCYRSMFSNCTSLTTAPVLSATTLASSCYSEMFKGCSSLNYIKAMFTTTPSSSYTYDWISGVSSTGTFIKNSEATWDVTGNNGIPTGWNVYTDAQWKEVKHYELDAELDALEDSLDDVHETIASALNDLDSRIEDINEVGAQANVIEAIKVNDELLPITDKTVNIYDIKYIHIDQTFGTDEHDEGVTRYLSNFRDSSITPEYFQDLATKYDLNHNFSIPANNSNVIFVTHDPDIGIFNYVYDKAFSSYFITDENESVDDFKTLALLLSTKNNIINLTNFNEEYGCCIIKWDNENNKWKFRWIENKKAIIPGNYNGFSEIYTTTTISAYDSDGSNNNAKIVLTGKESNDNAQINITTETDDGLRWNGRVVAVEEDYSTEYLTFVAKEAGTFTFTPQNNNVISYSTDNEETWTVGNSVAVNSGDKVLWKGTMTPGINGIGTFSSTANFDVQGNVMSLLYGDNFIGKIDLTGKNGAFVQLFYQNAKLVNAENLSLPATTLANDCYHSMFNGCTSLVNAPELPATTLAIYCYHSIFYGCTSLTTAPELPGTILVDGCYNNMFCNCFSLNYIRAMFTTTPGSQYTSTWVYGVSSTGIFIKNPLASWDVRGYDGIPQYWNNYLSTEINTINNKIQKIDPLILANNEYYIQKSNSVILPLSHPDLSTQPSILPERFGKYYIYEVMVPIFGDNIINNLSNASDEEIYVYEKNNESYLAFKDGGLLMNDSTIINASLIGNGVYDNPTIIKDEIIEEIDYANEYLTFVADESGTFTFTPVNNNIISYSKDNGLTWTEGNEVTVNRGDKVLWKGVMSPTGNGIGTFSSTANFDVQGNVMSLLWSDDFKEKVDLTGNDGAFKELFLSNLNNSTVVNAKNLILPATTLPINCYMSMFSGCGSLKTAPKLPATTLAESCYDSMFKNCTSLITAPSILPATTLANSCYNSMFFNCYTLKTAPELPAITLVSNCYNYMFYGCSSLNYIRAMFTTTPSSTYTDKWVLTVSATGTFIKNSAATWNVTGDNGIPTGWTVDKVTPYTYYEYLTTGIIDQFKINKIYTNLPLSTYAPKMNYLLVKYYNDQYLGDYGNYYE